jgi:hypothetical protein
MCVTLSLADEEKMSIEIDKPTTTDHQRQSDAALVRNFLFYLLPTGLERR